MIFAVDTSGKTAGVCLIKDNCVLFSKTLQQGFTHSQTLLELVQTAFSETNTAVKDVSAFAVTTGPGSFTGLRIGTSLVKGIAFANKTKTVPVSTLYAAALGCEENGLIITALDARRNEVYWAAFEKNGEECKRILPDTVTPVQNISNYVSMADKNIVFVGDGANLCYNVYGNNVEINANVSVAQSNIALGTALYAKEHGKEAVLPEQIVPNYIRLSQAERERLQKATKRY